MDQPLNMTIARKTVSEYPKTEEQAAADERAAKVPFGDPERRLPPIDALAHSGKYDSDAAYMMAIVSAWAYADEQVLAAKLKYYGFGNARIRRVTVQNNALLVVTTAYLVQSESGEACVLAFRGTDPGNYMTVLTDLQVMQRPFAGGRVHLGFYQSVEVVWDDVHAALVDAKAGRPLAGDPTGQVRPMQHLYVTGHSLGGAMAMLATARFFLTVQGVDHYAWLRGTLRGLYTYGQPMVGDARFTEFCEASFGKLVFRHVYNDDFIPLLPPDSSFDYAHAGPELRAATPEGPWRWVTEKSGRIRFGGLVSVLVNVAESRLSPVDRFPGYSIDDHMPLAYLEVSKLTRTATAAPARPRSVLARVAGFLPHGSA